MFNSAVSGEKRGLRVLKPGDLIRFDCHANLECFNRCCRNVAVFLTPYDIIRIKNALGISSEIFLSEYTQTWIGKNGLPAVSLKMKDDDDKSCPFLSPAGCSIYEDRPWSCRIYPLQPESTRLTEKAGKRYYSVMNVPFCKGFCEDRALTVDQWLAEQRVPEYTEMEKPFRKITLNPFFCEQIIKNQSIRQMYYTACYDLDRFRRFVFKSSFLQRFETEPEEIEQIKADDQALYKFAMKWLEYGFIGRHVLKVRPGVFAAKKRELSI